jgi:SAM-dependent methyltransferase
MDRSDWLGRVGDVWADEWRRTDRSFVPVDAALVDAAANSVNGGTGLRILDIGCGAGTTSFSIVDRLPGACLTGVDLSAALVNVAQARAAHLPRCHFVQGDAAEWSAETGFDLLVSRHGVMFFADPIAAFMHLRGLARPGAPLIFSCFRAPALNLWASGLAHLIPAPSDPNAAGPFAFADEDRVHGILAGAGWQDAAAQPLDFGYVAGEGEDPAADAVSFFRRIGPVARAAADLDETGRARLLDGLDAMVKAHVDGNRVILRAAAWIWSATA